MALAVVVALTALAAGASTAAAASLGAGVVSAQDPGGGTLAAADDELTPLESRGRELYLTGCGSCHGLDGEGVEDIDETGVQGPSLRGVGAAAADFMLRSGRMPLANVDEQATRKPQAYDNDEIEAIVAYVATLGDGPPIPELDLDSADEGRGGELFRQNCASCHSATGAGGALSYGRHAPNLGDATEVEVAEAIRIGPGQMPVFGPETITDAEVDAIVLHVRALGEPDDRGGLSLGSYGPFSEGLAIWVAGLVPLLLAVGWITKRPST